MIKGTLASLLAVCVAAALLGLVGGSALATLSDTETSADNTFTAGTLLLRVGNLDGSTSATLALPAIGPLHRGQTGSIAIQVQNAGTIDGSLSIGVGTIADQENGAAPGEAGDTGEPGELSGVLDVTMACGAPLAAGKLSSWAGRSFGPVHLPAGATKWLEIGWALPDAVASDAAMGDTAVFDIVLTLVQRH